MSDNDIGILVVFLVIILSLALLTSWAINTGNKQAAAWRLIATGIFDHAEYETYYVRVHHGSTSRSVVMAVSFTDGRAYEINGRCDVPFPRGTLIDVMENGLGYRKVVEHKG